MTSAIVDSALHYFADSFALVPTCGGSVEINCTPAGTPLAMPLTITAYTITQRAAPDTLVFDWEADVKLVSPAIPVTLPAPLGPIICTLHIDTRPGTDSTAHSTGTATFSAPTAGGPISRLDVAVGAVTGVESDDVSISGGVACDLATFGASVIIGTVTMMLETDLPLCSARGPKLFEVCPAP